MEMEMEMTPPEAEMQLRLPARGAVASPIAKGEHYRLYLPLEMEELADVLSESDQFGTSSLCSEVDV